MTGVTINTYKSDIYNPPAKTVTFHSETIDQNIHIKKPPEVAFLVLYFG